MTSREFGKVAVLMGGPSAMYRDVQAPSGEAKTALQALAGSAFAPRSRRRLGV